MLALKLGLSLVSTPKLGGWSPDDEASLEAWYQNKVGITLNGSDVSQWDDSSPNNLDMVQGTASEQPSYASDTGYLAFVSADKNNLQTAGQVSLAGDFTVGIRIYPSIAAAGTFLADNTTANEFFKFTTASNLRIKIDGSTANIALDSGTFGGDYLVITRASDVFTLWQNGQAQSGTPTLAGTTDIDAIGIRSVDTDGFDGTIGEIQIYSSSSTELTANINDRLSTL
jgi:hypothetical protein